MNHQWFGSSSSTSNHPPYPFRPLVTIVCQIFSMDNLSIFFCSAQHMRDFYLPPAQCPKSGPSTHHPDQRCFPLSQISPDSAGTLLFTFLVSFSLLANFRKRKFNRRDRDEQVTLLSNLERILHTSHRSTTASSTLTPFRNLQIAFKSLEASLEKVAGPISRAESEDTFHGLSDRPVSKESPVSGNQPTQSRSSAKLKNTLRGRIASISAVVEDAVVRLFSDARRATESSSDTKVMSAIRTVVNRLVTKAF